MADDINAQRRTELNNQLNNLMPKIRGLDDLAAPSVSISPELRAKVVDQSNLFKNRRALIQAELSAMDVVNQRHADLLDDGYPDLEPASVPDSLFAELHEEQSDIAAAVGVFQSEATGMAVKIGEPRPKE
jgi:hypothetical protein